MCTLNRVIDNFLSGVLPVTDKARRLLERLRLDPTATSAPQPTKDNEEHDMATKTKKVKKEPKAKKPAAEKGYKGHRAGSRKEAAHKYFDEKKPTREAFVAYCAKLGLAEVTSSNRYRLWSAK